MLPLPARPLGISRLSAAGEWRPHEAGPWGFIMACMISVWLPHLPIERLKRQSKATLFPDNRPFALVGSEERGLLLTALNVAAIEAGLYPRMGLADARAICPHLLTAPADRDKDKECLIALARWSIRYSPNLNVDGIDGLWLDGTGVPHLFGGESALLADMEKRFARLGFSAKLALAETLGGATRLPASRLHPEPSFLTESSERPLLPFPSRLCALRTRPQGS